jgi:predicted nuclease of predicted toxin-antitoxin system
MIRFHLDEHISPAIAAGLRQRGIDVTTTIEAGLAGADDSAHIAFAMADGRVIVTHDEDYLVHHAQGTVHAGVAYCHQAK